MTRACTLVPYAQGRLEGRNAMGPRWPRGQIFVMKKFSGPGAQVKNLKVPVKIFFTWPLGPFLYKFFWIDYFGRENWPRGRFLKVVMGPGPIGPPSSRPCLRVQRTTCASRIDLQRSWRHLECLAPYTPTLFFCFEILSHGTLL